MKTAQTILHDFNWATKYDDKETIIQAMKAYAQSAIDEIKEKIVGEACVHWPASNNLNPSVNPESIRSVTIELK